MNENTNRSNEFENAKIAVLLFITLLVSACSPAIPTETTGLTNETIPTIIQEIEQLPTITSTPEPSEVIVYIDKMSTTEPGPVQVNPANGAPPSGGALAGPISAQGGPGALTPAAELPDAEAVATGIFLGAESSGDSPIMIVLTSDTVIYKDITFANVDPNNPPQPGIVVQQIVELAVLDDIATGAIVSIWGEVGTDRIIAATIVFSLPPAVNTP